MACKRQGVRLFGGVSRFSRDRGQGELAASRQCRWPFMPVAMPPNPNACHVSNLPPEMKCMSSCVKCAPGLQGSPSPGLPARN